MKRVLSRLLVAGLLAAPLAANATLLGENITVDWLFPDAATIFATDTVAVGAGAEISCPGAGVGLFALCSGFAVGADIDIGADTISLFVLTGSSSWTGAAFNGYRFSDLSLGGPWSSVSVATNFGGLDASRYSFDGSTLLVNMQGFAANAGDFFTFTLLRDVPEPTSAALLGLALVSYGWRRRSAG